MDFWAKWGFGIPTKVEQINKKYKPKLIEIKEQTSGSQNNMVNIEGAHKACKIYQEFYKELKVYAISIGVRPETGSLGSLDDYVYETNRLENKLRETSRSRKILFFAILGASATVLGIIISVCLG